jgi:hypothetical protein
MPETQSKWEYTADGNTYSFWQRWTLKDKWVLVTIAENDTEPRIQGYYKEQAGAKKAAARLISGGYHRNSQFYIDEMRLVESKVTLSYWEITELETKVKQYEEHQGIIAKVIEAEQTKDGKAALQRLFVEYGVQIDQALETIANNKTE